MMRFIGGLPDQVRGGGASQPAYPAGTDHLRNGPCWAVPRFSGTRV